MHKDQLSNTNLENYLLYCLDMVGYKFYFLFFVANITPRISKWNVTLQSSIRFMDPLIW
jgi:hypothetical protein